jgi:hypothetical protein
MTSSTQSPASLDDFVVFIAELVNEHHHATSKPTDGALLAERIRHQFPDFSYEKLGIAKLADAIDYAEQKGLLVRNRFVKHLEVLPHGVQPRRVAPAVVTASRILHIRPDIWRAFVYVSEGQANYFDRHTGRVTDREALSHDPDSGQHVPVTGIPLTDQQQWMAEFLRRLPHLDPSDAPIRDPYCFAKFPVWLRERAAGLDREWKLFRVQHVAERIRVWAENNGIDPSVFFPPPVNPLQRDEVLRSPLTQERAIRAAIAAAARNLPLEQLQDISIPIRYVLQALKGT